MTVRNLVENDKIQCAKIVEGLTDWFDDNEIRTIKNNFSIDNTYVCEDDGLVLGFICVKEKFNSTIEIESLGVDINRQGCGAGTELLKYVENELADGKIIMVKTLDSSSGYTPYIKTREFYEKNDYLKIEVIDHYPGWAGDFPCAIYVKMPKYV